MADIYGRVRNPEYSEEAKAFIKAQVEGYHTWQLNAAGVGRMVYFLAALVFFIVVLYEQYSKRKERLSKLPPGPFLWPYLGCLPYLHSKGGSKLSLRAKVADLAKIHGPLMFLQIADAQFVVVSSGELAKEVLIAHDAEFYYRPRCAEGRHLGFGFADIAFSSGNHHFLLRKLCTSHLFSPARLASYGHIHQAEVAKMMHSVWEASNSKNGDGHILVRATVTALVRNSLCRILLGRTHLDVSNISMQFNEGALASLMDKAMAVAGEVTLSDLTPALKWLDRRGRGREMKTLQRQLTKYFQVIIEERRGLLKKPKTAELHPEEEAVVLDVLLSLQEEEPLSDRAIMGVLLDILVCGTYKTSSTVEWALTELVRHPAVLEKIQTEMNEVVGPHRIVKEADLPQLPYFQAVVKETLRLHPVMPLSLPHMNIVATPILKYEIPAKTSVLIDYAAIGRDPATWKDPLQFEPQRFADVEEASQMDTFKLIPFGYGRRGCPGANLGLVSVQLALASLIQGFEWAPVEGQTPHDIDVNESSGMVCFKETPLVLSATHRLSRTLYEL